VARKSIPASAGLGYDAVLDDIVELVESARRSSARAVNSLITATYWAIGRRIVEQEQHGQARADYGAALMDRLAADLTARFGRGFGRRNLFQMRALYLAYHEIPQTVSARSVAAAKVQTSSALFTAITRLDDKVTACGSGPVRRERYCRGALRARGASEPGARRRVSDRAPQGAYAGRRDRADAPAVRGAPRCTANPRSAWFEAVMVAGASRREWRDDRHRARDVAWANAARASSDDVGAVPWPDATGR
jgi:hypothetical protein